MRKGLMGIVAVAAALAAALLSPTAAMAASGTAMWRLYNPNSGEHFYTAGVTERNNLVSVGWRSEGVGWIAPETGQDVYRLYNPNGGDHHYTTSSGERDILVKAGWRYEGVGWKSGGSVPVYRQYNKNASSGAHNFTPSKSEGDGLVKAGWKSEGIAWQAAGTSADYDPSPINAAAHGMYEGIIAANPYVEWYGYLDIDGDGVDEMFMDVYDFQGGSARDYTLYGYWDGILRAVYFHSGYGVHVLHVYPKTLGLVEYCVGHGNELYEYYRWANGQFSNVAYANLYPATGYWNGHVGTWRYVIGRDECTQEQLNAYVSDITQGPCTVYDTETWATKLYNR